MQRYRVVLQQRAREGLDVRLSARIDADDVVQQTMMHATQGFDSFRGTTSKEFSSWLLNIHERNIRLAMRFHAQTKKRKLDDEVPWQELGKKGDVNLYAPRRQHPEKLVRRDEKAARLGFFLEGLPEAQREAIRFRFIDELPISDIALRMERSEKAVGALLRRGIQALNEVMNESSWISSE